MTELMHLFSERVELICVEFNENRKVRIALLWSGLVCRAALAHKCLTDGPSVHQADKQQRQQVLFNVSVELCAGSSRLALIKILRIRTTTEARAKQYDMHLFINKLQMLSPFRPSTIQVEVRSNYIFQADLLLLILKAPTVLSIICIVCLYMYCMYVCVCVAV